MNGSIMDANLFYIRLLCLIGALLTISSCFDDDYCHVKYQFQIDFQITPDEPIFRIGDTIHISSKIDKYEEDLNSGEIIDLGTSSTFPMFFVVEAPIDSLLYNSSFYDFSFIEKSGTYSVFDNGDIQTLDFEYNFLADTRIINFDLIPNEVGNYVMYFAYNNTYYEENFLQTENDCNEVGELVLTTNQNQGNYYLLTQFENSPFTDSITFTEAGGFAFKVIQ